MSHTVAGTKLVLPGQSIESTIDVWLYFTPDLPLEITLEEVQKAGGGKGLDPDYETRCRTRGCNPTHPKLQPYMCSRLHPYASQDELLVGRPTERGAAQHCGRAAARDRV